MFFVFLLWYILVLHYVSVVKWKSVAFFCLPYPKTEKSTSTMQFFVLSCHIFINYLHHSFLNMKFLFEVYCTGISVLLLFISGDDYYHFPKKQSNWVLKKRLIRNKQQDMINQASQVSTLCLTLKIQLIWIEPRFWHVYTMYVLIAGQLGNTSRTEKYKSNF